LSAPSAVAALATFLREHPERTLSVAVRLKHSGRLLDSTVGGRSMGDTLPDGAPIRIQLSAREEFARGEVVAFWNGRQVTVHRVLFCGRRGRRRGVVVTRGDAYLCPDLPFHVSVVLGPVVAVRTARGWHEPDVAPRRTLAQRAVAGAWEEAASALCWLDVALARRGLAALYFLGRTLRSADWPGLSMAFAAFGLRRLAAPSGLREVGLDLRAQSSTSHPNVVARSPVPDGCAQNAA
jgi:hypothetical protein